MDRLDELRLIAAIVEGGSLAAAGRRLALSPPAVTRTLAALERRLGVRLIERTTRSTRPTEAGARLAEHGRRVLADYAEAVAEAADDAAAPRGRLRIAAPLVFGRRHVAPIVAELLDAHPLVGADLLLADRNTDLMEDAIDVAVRIGPLPDASLSARRVGSLRRLVCASPGYLAVRGTPASPRALAAHETVQFASPTIGVEWRFAAETVRVAPRFTVNSAEAAIDAAIAGRGIVSAFSYQVTAELAAGRLVRLLREHEPPPIPVSLLFASGRLLPRRVRVFLDLAATRLGAMPILREDAP